MTASVISLTIITGIVAVGSLAGFYAGSRHKMDLEQWTVGGRGFGLVLVWLLMAGEVYTTFTFLGASGWAYSKGGPALYILGYQPLWAVVSFFILPQIWEVGRKYHLQTEADFFQLRYGSKYLAALVAVIGFVFIIPYLQLQLTGLGIIVEVASYGSIGRVPAIVIAFAVVAAFVFVSGVRGIAWVSVLKDFLLLFAAIFVGIAIPYIYFHGIGHMFAALARAKPQHLVMPGSTPNLGHAWYASSVLLTALGFYMWPQSFAQFHRPEWQYSATKCGNHSALQHHDAFDVLRWPDRAFGAAGSWQRQSFSAHDRAKDFSRLVSGNHRWGGSTYRHGPRWNSSAYRFHLVCQEPLSPHVCPGDDRPAGCKAGQSHGAGVHVGGGSFCGLERCHPSFTVAAGLRGSDPVFSWRCVGPLFKEGH